jgi:hypothetical protein
MSRAIADFVPRPDFLVPIFFEGVEKFIPEISEVVTKWLDVLIGEWLKIVCSNKFHRFLAGEPTVSDVFASVVGRSTVSELQYFEVLMAPVDALVDVYVVTVVALSGIFKYLKAICQGDFEVFFAIPVEVVARENGRHVRIV